jgi:hypothetical protein
MMEKEKLMIEIITIPMEDAVVLAKTILTAEYARDVEEAVVDAMFQLWQKGSLFY